MAFIPTPHAAKVSIEASLGPATVVNTFYVSKSDNYSSADLAALLGNVEAVWVAYILPLLVTQYSVEDYVAYAQESNTAPVVHRTPGVTHTGAGTPDTVLPANVAMAVNHRTANRGRSGRGRTFMAGFGGDDIDDPEFWKAVSVSAMTSAWTNIRTILASDGHTFCVVSKQHDKVALTQGLIQAVISSDTDDHIDTMRKRVRP